jgi:hypothetical protein
MYPAFHNASHPLTPALIILKSELLTPSIHEPFFNEGVILKSALLIHNDYMLYGEFDQSEVCFLPLKEALFYDFNRKEIANDQDWKRFRDVFTLLEDFYLEGRVSHTSPFDENNKIAKACTELLELVVRYLLSLDGCYSLAPIYNKNDDEEEFYENEDDMYDPEIVEEEEPFPDYESYDPPYGDY